MTDVDKPEADQIPDDELENVGGGVGLAIPATSALRQTGEKGGTADINIGVGELHECTISK